MEGKRKDDKKRCKNFSESEVKILLDLVKKNKNILECKKTDFVSHKEKNKTWLEIEKEFNVRSGLIYRDFKILRVKYDNLKKSAKKRFTEEKAYSSGTGGGPCTPSTVSTTDLEIKDILGSAQIEGGCSEFDSDHVGKISNIVLTADSEIDLTYIEDDVSYEVEKGVPPSTESQLVEESPKDVNVCAVDFGQVTNLRSVPTSTLLVTSNKKSKNVRNFDRTAASRKIDSLASSKEELIKIQKQIFEQQLAFEKEEHVWKLEEQKLRIESLKLDIKLKTMDLELKMESKKT